VCLFIEGFGQFGKHLFIFNLHQAAATVFTVFVFFDAFLQPVNDGFSGSIFHIQVKAAGGKIIQFFLTVRRYGSKKIQLHQIRAGHRTGRNFFYCF